jgi:hypothetical protein
MIIALWVDAVVLVLAALAIIATVGKPRKPITGGEAVVAVIITSVQAGLVISAALTLAGR